MFSVQRRSHRCAMHSTVEAAKRYSFKPEEAKPGSLRVGITGILSLATVKDFNADVEGLLDKTTAKAMTLDLAGIEYLDSTGALAVVLSRDKAARRSIEFEMTGMSAETRRMLGIVDFESPRDAAPPVKANANAWTRLQDAAVRLSDSIDLMCLFVGDLAASLASSMIRPRSVRWEAVLHYMKRAGMEGLPIVGLISILLGMIMAFMASLQLRMFGANLYVASLVSIALVKELGPIMTAIIFAGRSGSAFSRRV